MVALGVRYRNVSALQVRANRLGKVWALAFRDGEDAGEILAAWGRFEEARDRLVVRGEHVKSRVILSRARAFARRETERF